MPVRVRPVTFLIGLAVLLASALPAGAQRTTDRAALESLSLRLGAEADARRGPLYRRLLERSAGPQGALNRDPNVQLMFVDARRVPRFYTTDNLNAAGTVNTDDVWPGGIAGYALSGAGTALGELGEWDGGGVRTTHVEFGGRVTQMDSPAGLSSHSTHVAGTLIAAGANAAAKGMSFEGTLAAHDWFDDDVEMAAAAAGGMLASNHSYGYVTGWYYNFDGSGNWFWFGDTTVSTVEDYGFGYYDGTSRAWDEIAFNAPDYLILKSAGNDRNDAAPAQPDSHYVWDPGAEDWVWSMTVRNTDGWDGGFDTVTWHGVAKNILTVGAVNDIAAGWTGPTSVVMTTFSAWGPTDDGRIKPDIVANGASLFSCTSTSNGSYGSSSGTSMSTPNTTGTVNLLSHHYRATHSGETPRAATMKAVLLHTANEAGFADGPDYRHGWGLLNASGAAGLIAADSVLRIREETLANGASDPYVIQHPGGDLKITIAWTDPPGTPVAPVVDAPDPMLVNDLDLRVQHLATMDEHLPWVLDPANPVNAATRGDNVVDNVEQVFVAAAPAGVYTVTVSHKGTLENLAQDYSIVASGELEPASVLAVGPNAEGTDFAIGGVWPNPFSGGTRIELVLPARAAVEAGVYDLGGRRVRALDRSIREAGRHTLAWDGRDDRGARLPAGVYFVRASAGGASALRRLVLLD